MDFNLGVVGAWMVVKGMDVNEEVNVGSRDKEVGSELRK